MNIQRLMRLVVVPFSLISAIAHADEVAPAANATAPAAADVAPPSAVAQSTPPAPPSMLLKFDTTFYGFVEVDMMHDSTQSYGDSIAVNDAILKRTTYGGKTGAHKPPPATHVSDLR